jgi:hypothetical protein
MVFYLLVAVKVLYTFDSRNENKCLAKWPRILNIRTAHVHDGTQIGAVDLKTCLEAVTFASPEIFDDDYVVYAYDPSEYGTPQVGHGKLSQIFPSEYNRPNSPNDLPDMIAGTVRSGMGLFASNIQDTLEVQLRLAPVARRGNNMASSGFQNSVSHSPQNLDTQAMSDIINKISPDMLAILQGRRTSSGTPPGSSGPEVFQRLITPNFPSQFGRIQNNACSSYSTISNTSRQASPAPSVGSVASQASRRTLKRTHSNVSNTLDRSFGDQLSMHDSGYLSNDDRIDDGRKRAKIIQVDRPSKSNLNKRIDSLRVAASSAASVRMHQPTAVRSSANPVTNLEEPPRAPTPVPESIPLRRQPTVTRSNLYDSRPVDYNSPYSDNGNLPTLPNSTVTSPEGNPVNIGNSPDNLTSSPPIIREASNYPSSPALPPLPMHEDSGFMSGNIEALSCDENEDDSPTAEDMRVIHYRMQSDSLKSSEPTRPSVAELRALERSHNQARRAVGLKALLSLPVISPSDSTPSSDPVKKPSKATNDQSKSKGRSWDKEKRKNAMQNKLAKSVAAGELPQYCHNCGAIETPTWRKAYYKEHSGCPKDIKTSKGEGTIIAWEPIEFDGEGKTCVFRIYKKSLLPSDDAFIEYLMCNRKSKV